MAASPLKMGGLTPLEIASAVVAGRDSAAFLPEHEPGVSAVAALERLILQALSRPPCLISFSGGRDSSGILALAARVARREGLADPIPVTARFPGVAGADECAWQEHVVSHLDIQDWLRLEFKDELDLVGPVATQLMERQGLFYPWNLHLQSSLIEPARGGSFVTGIGGDEVLAPGSRALSVLAGHSRPRARDALRIALAFAPRSVRCAVLARRRPLHFPWLLPEANDALARSWARELARFPVSWDARLREWWRSRYLQLMLSVLGTLAADFDAQTVHPLADPNFLSALADDAGRRGFPGRTAAVEALFGEVLPLDVRRRSTKASFDPVLWNRYSRAFAAGLLEDGLDRALRRLGVDGIVDPSSLASVWSNAEPPPANSYLLLQACWLASRGDVRSTPAGAAQFHGSQ